MKDVFKLGTKGPITPDEIYKPKSNLESRRITEKFVELWSEELKKKNPSVLRVVFKIYGFPLLSLGILFSILESSMRSVKLKKF